MTDQNPENMNEPTDLPDDLIDGYLQGALQVAKTNEELHIIDTAKMLGLAAKKAQRSTESGRLSLYSRLTESTQGTERRGVPPDRTPALASLILKEIREALCKNGARYRTERKELRDNANMLIGALAMYIAGLLGLQVVVVAALVATILRIVLKIGVSAFCKMAN